MSNLQEAEHYLRASWTLTQDGIVASHLCRIYERLHKIEPAIQMCRLAVYRIPMSEQLTLSQYEPEMHEAQRRLDRLTGGAGKSKATGDASDVTIRQRNYKLPRFFLGTESAEFFVLLVSDGKSKTFKVEDVKFVGGSDKMKLRENN